MRALLLHAMRGKKVFWILMAAFLIPAIGFTIVAWRVVGQVRRDALVTDARLRELAWSVLAYADEANAFPISEAELRAFTSAAAGVPATLREVASTGSATSTEADATGYPRTRAEVTTALVAPTLDESLSEIEVEWPTARDVQPIFRSKGKATLHGTSPSVGEWLYAMAQRIRTR